jgi:hypothetical protein
MLILKRISFPLSLMQQQTCHFWELSLVSTLSLSTGLTLNICSKLVTKYIFSPRILKWFCLFCNLRPNLTVLSAAWMRLRHTVPWQYIFVLVPPQLLITSRSLGMGFFCTLYNSSPLISVLMEATPLCLLLNKRATSVQSNTTQVCFSSVGYPDMYVTYCFFYVGRLRLVNEKTILLHLLLLLLLPFYSFS